MNGNHKNARTVVFGRELIVRRVWQEGMKVSWAARQPGVGRRTAYKWLARHRAPGKSGMENRGSRPRPSPRGQPVEKASAIAALRRGRLSGPRIAFTFSLPVSSVSGD